MSQLYPAMLDPKTLSRQVWDVATARRIPGVGRAIDLIGGLISQMDLDAYVGIVPQPRPRLLEDPDLDNVRSLFVRMQIEDYLCQGNALHLVTARGSDGWPAATRWYPAQAWGVMEYEGRRRYWLHGREVDPSNVVHVQNGADPSAPYRGVGVIERYVRTLDRVALQEEAERTNLTGGSVPSVAVILPPADDSSDEDLDDAADRWEEKFSGVPRRPGFLPHGTDVKPLAWNPSDAQAVEARQMSLVDVANAFNLDGYWLGAQSSSHTYRSPGAMFLTLMVTTLAPIVRPFEDTWTLKWLARGKRVVFNRQAILVDDFPTLIGALTKATGGPIMTPDEGRTRLQLGPVPGGDELRAPSPDTPADPVSADPTDPAADPSSDNPEGA